MTTKVSAAECIAWVGEAMDLIQSDPVLERRLEAWSSEFVTGSGEFTLWDWPGWVDTDLGAHPQRRS